MKTKPVSSKRGLEIINQGAQQFMAMGFEDSRGNPNCPFNPITQAIETKLWLTGYNEARFKWVISLDKNELYVYSNRGENYGKGFKRFKRNNHSRYR
jgi:hypothetical protein